MWLSDFFFLIKLMKILSSPVLNQIHERIFSAIMIEFLQYLSLKIYLNNDVWYKKNETILDKYFHNKNHHEVCKGSYGLIKV